MTRLNKTINNLENIWQQLDDACGSLYNALDNIGSMTDLENIKEDASQIDFSAIVALKNEVEELIEEKKKKSFKVTPWSESEIPNVQSD